MQVLKCEMTNPMVRKVIYGQWDVYSMKCWLFNHPLGQRIWKDSTKRLQKGASDEFLINTQMIFSKF
jgi:hypothetical protein